VAEGTEGLRLEDWIGKKVTVAVYSREEVTSRERTIIGMEVVADEESVSERPVVLEVEGFLEGVDPNRVIVLFDPGDVVRQRGGGAPYARAELRPRHVFFPWQRVSLIQRIEETKE
jgi:hypothetical protein